ncbi:hypothetical protein Tco_1178526, partial [Tanacetum coccineum]
ELGNKDADMNNADQGGIDQQNASQQSRFQQEEKDAHVTLTPVINTQKTGGLIQSSSVSSDFTITLTPTPTTSKATTAIPALPDFASVFKFNERVTNLEKDLYEMKQVDQYAQALSLIPAIVDRYKDNKLGEVINKAIQAHNFNCREESQAEKREDIELSSYEAAATLFEFELTKILIDKIEKNKSFDVADYKIDLYNALVKSYNTEKDIFESYGEVFSLKRSQDERDKDRDPSAGSDRGTKRRKLKEPSHTVEDSGKQQDQEFVTGDNDEQPADKEVTKAFWFKKPERPLTPDPDWSKRQQLKYDQHAYLGTSHWGAKCQSFYGYASNLTSSKDVYSRRRISAVTRLKIMRKYDYSHLEEIEVHRYDQKLYTFKEGDFKRLRLQYIGDMLLLLVKQKLTNLTINERSNLGNRTTYTSYPDPHGIIYVDQNRRKRLMRADELHKFSDGTLNDVRSTLHDIATGIRMEYLPMRK